MQRRQGQLLAQLHIDLASIQDRAQRPGFVLATEVFGSRLDGPPLNDVLGNGSLIDPNVASRLLEYAHRARERLDAGGADHLPSQVIHGDLQPGNTFFAGGRLSGIIDFDFARLDHRIADFSFVWWGRHDAVIEGYEEISPLSEQERALLAPVFWATLLDGVRQGRLWPTNQAPKSPRALVRLLDHRSPLHDW